MGLCLTDITKSFNGKSFLCGVNLSLQPAEVVGLGGASGAGKSTLARIAAGHVNADRGQVRLDGRPVPALGTLPSPVQYASQSAELACDPRWRVRDVLRNGGEPDEAVLDALDIRPAWADRPPSTLSGGELARVSLARLLGPKTRYLFCDEITAQLDALAQARFWPLLLGLARTRGIGVLVISHDARLRRQICRRNLVISDAQVVTEVAESRLHQRSQVQPVTKRERLRHRA